MSNEKTRLSIIDLALKSFGLVVPEELHDEEPFDLMDLEEDALIRVDVVNDVSNKIIFSDSSRNQTAVSVNELERYYDALLPKWVCLTPTQQVIELTALANKD